MSTILLVEDDETNRDMLSRRLKRQGFDILIATNGQECVKIANSEMPDLILMDMSSPVLDGWEATRLIKSKQKISSIPVIALTACTLSEDRDRALKAGCDEYDTKPVVLKRLLKKMQPLLDKRHVIQNEPASLLAVDDNEENLDILSRGLGQLGHSVTVAVDGSTALQLIRRQPFDLVLLDVAIPGINGLEVLERVRRDWSPTGMPIIMTSVRDRRADVILALQAGANDYVTKPLDFPVVQARVETQLALKRSVERSRMLEGHADDLLRVLLPDSIAEELKATAGVKPRRYNNVAVLFTDVVDFSRYCDGREPGEILNDLQEMVHEFEMLVHKHDLLKMKTIGDAFMASGGLLEAAENPVANCVRCGLDMICTMRSLRAGWNLRVGVHVGPVIAGIVGHYRYLFDIWGDTVNIAARVERHGKIGAVNLSQAAWNQVSSEFSCSAMNKVEVKGRGKLDILQIDPPAIA